MHKTQAFKRLILSFGLNRKITMEVENKPVLCFSQEMEVKTFLPEVDISIVLCQKPDDCTPVSKSFCKGGIGDY
jgi:hypothetical protein